MDEASVGDLRFGEREGERNANGFGLFLANRLMNRPVRSLACLVAISVEIGGIHTVMDLYLHR